MDGSAPGLWVGCLNGGGELFNIVAWQAFDRLILAPLMICETVWLTLWGG